MKPAQHLQRLSVAPSRYLCSRRRQLCVSEDPRRRRTFESAAEKERMEEAREAGSQRDQWKRFVSFAQMFEKVDLFVGTLHLLTVCWCLCVSRSGRGSLSALVRLLRQFVLRPSLLDAHLQAGVEGGAGVHTPPPEREPRPGAVPALPVCRRAELPDAAGARRRQALVAGIAVFLVVAPRGGGQVQVRAALSLVPPPVPSHVFSVLDLVLLLVAVAGGKDETSRVSQKLRRGRDGERTDVETGPEGARGRQKRKRVNNQKPFHTCGNSPVSKTVPLSQC